MSSPGYASSLRIEPGFSRCLASLVVLSHGGVLPLIPLLPVSWWLRLALAVLVFISFWRQFRLQVLRRDPQAITALEWRADGSWLLTARNGINMSPALKADSYVHPALVILNFSGTGNRLLSIVLFRDSLDHDTFRRLRLRLGTMRLAS